MTRHLAERQNIEKMASGRCPRDANYETSAVMMDAMRAAMRYLDREAEVKAIAELNGQEPDAILARWTEIDEHWLRQHQGDFDMGKKVDVVQFTEEFDQRLTACYQGTRAWAQQQRYNIDVFMWRSAPMATLHPETWRADANNYA